MSMDIKAILKNPLNQQYIAEILFPVIGYFLLDWSLLIIVVFYLLDQLANQILFFKRLNKVIHYREKGGVFIWLSIGLFLIIFIAELWILNGSFNTISDLTGTCYHHELEHFAKDELWFIFPLLILMYHLQDKMMFYMPKRYANHHAKSFFGVNLIENILILLLIFGATYIYSFLNISDGWVIVGIIATKLLFDLALKPQIKKFTIR